MAKKRLDHLLVEQGLAPDIQTAEKLIISGSVYFNTERFDKPGHLLKEDSKLEVKSKKDHPWVSRGGVKLAHAIEHFKVKVDGFICLDVGASTGGFTDVLLIKGADKVYAVDVGYGELAWKLQQDDRVIVLDRTNAKDLNSDIIPDEIDIVVSDVSFTSLKNALPKPLGLAKDGAELVALIKPQFEVRKDQVGKGGIVRDPELHKEVCEDIKNWLENIGWSVQSIIESPITGMEGNKEFLIYASNK